MVKGHLTGCGLDRYSHVSSISIHLFVLVGFYTLTGVFTIAGMHFLPIYLYFWSHYPSPGLFLGRLQVLLVAIMVLLVIGRFLGLIVEVSNVYHYRVHPKLGLTLAL